MRQTISPCVQKNIFIDAFRLLDHGHARDGSDDTTTCAIHEIGRKKLARSYTMTQLNPSTYQATFATENGGNDWAPKTDGTYAGNFYARATPNKSADTSWANLAPPIELNAKELMPEQLTLKELIDKAKFMDADVDGKTCDFRLDVDNHGLQTLAGHALRTSNAGASSAVREGEEKFIYGAVYNGLQGVSISESAGLVAAYTRGAKVDWVKGNKWTYQDEGWAVSEVNVDTFNSTTAVANQYSVQVDADTTNVVSNAKKSTAAQTCAGTDISRFNSAGLLIDTVNVAGTGIVTSNTAGAGIATNNVATGSVSTCNLTAGVFSTTTCASLGIHKYEHGGPLFKTVISAASRVELNITYNTMHIYNGNNSSSGLSNRNYFKTILDFALVETRQIHNVNYTGCDITTSFSNSTQNNNSMIFNTTTNVEDIKYETKQSKATQHTIDAAIENAKSISRKFVNSVFNAAGTTVFV